MALPSGLHLPPRESFLLEQRSEGSLSGVSTAYRGESSGEDEEFPPFDTTDYISERTRRTLIGRVLHALGIQVRPSSSRSAEYDYFSNSRDELPDGLLSQKKPREGRRWRRSKMSTLVRRTCLALPVALLIVFGVLHVIQAVYGHAQLFWESEDYDEKFLPDWGKPGHFGDGLADYPTDATRDVVPIPCHSHNDYWRRVPVFDAIHWGCTGIEADVWLFDDELFVGHSKSSLTRNRTFTNLYINPLTEFLDRMNPQTEFSNTTHHGVFDENPEQTLVLLVDIKTSGHETYQYVHDQLNALRERDYLSFWDGERFHSRAVTVVGTGNTPFELIQDNKSHRDIFFDAPLDQLWEPVDESNEPPLDDTTASSSLDPRTSTSARAAQQKPPYEIPSSASLYDRTNSYYASVSFTKTIGYVWRGRLTSQQLGLIRGQILGAQRRGLKVRYWDTPSWPRGLRNHVWHVLMREGADVLNVDDLHGAAVENWRARIHRFWG